MKSILCLLISLISVSRAWAGVSEILPEGINSPMFKFGYIQGINQKYDSSGQLWRLGDLRSVQFDAQTLAKINPQAQVLINTLNRFGNMRLGDSLNLGVLEFDIDPKVNYFAPIYARGITKNWTLAFALPVVTYKNNIRISQSFSNIEFYKREFGGQSAELDQALDTDLRYETLRSIESAGYRPLTDKDETFLHDAQVVSMYKFFEKDRVTLLHSAYVGLPTGPAYDPDDLAALNISGQSSLDNGVTFAYRMNYGFKYLSTLSYLFFLPDQITKRVPKSEDDVLPDSSTKENLDRTLGSKVTFKNEIEWKFSDQYKIVGGYAYGQKTADSYSGSEGRRYDLLTQNTAGYEHVVSVSVAYDTVTSYFKKKSLIPMIISYDVADTILGKNIERKTVQEINLILFF